MLELVRPYFFLQDDNRDDFLPLYVHDLRALAHGELALFNFHQFLGIPHLAAGQTAVLYPPVYAALALSRLFFGHVFAAIDLLVILELAAGAAGAFMLLRRLGASSEAAFFGGLSWGLCPFAALVGAFWATVAPPAMLLPWLILLSIRLLEDGRPAQLGALSAARTLLFFAGYPEYFLYTVAFECAFALAAAERRRLGPWLASLPLTALFCSPLLIPLDFEASWSAERSGPLSYALFTFQHAAPARWLQGLVWPFSGVEAPRAHAGWAGLVLAALGAKLALEKDAPRWSRAALALGALALLWGCGFLDRALYLVPVLNRFRFHFKLLLFAQFSLVLLASLAFSRRRPSSRWAAALCAFQAVNLVAVAALAAPGGFVLDSRRPPLSEPFAPLLREGRLASLGARPRSPGDFSRTLGFDYATLWGLYHFAGYDPLVPATNFVEALQVNEDALLDQEVSAPATLERLRFWGVRRLVVRLADLPRYRRTLDAAGARELARDDERAVLDLPGARPLAFWSASPERALPVRFGVNEATVETDSPADGELVLNVVRQSGFSTKIDGRATKPTLSLEPRPSVKVPAGRHEVTFAYEEPAFKLGCALAAAAALSLWLWASAVARRREG